MLLIHERFLKMAPKKIYPIILSGGSGTRLWPLSRHYIPKQFLPFNNEEPLIIQSIKRLNKNMFFNPTIITSVDHRFLVAQTLEDAKIHNAKIILEPVARNTAASVAIAASLYDENALICIFPSDHFIGDPSVLNDVILKTTSQANNYIFTLGIKPRKPETGYGYISKGKKINLNIFEIKKFIEKPTAKKAVSLISKGALWNSGIFIFKAKNILDAYTKHAPKILKNAQTSLKNSELDMDFLRLEKKSFKNISNIPFDIAIMEKISNAAVLPCNPKWSDLGNYVSLEEQQWDQGDILSLNTKDCFLYGDGILVTAANISNINLIATKDVVMATPKGDSKSIQTIQNKLIRMGRTEATDHPKKNRPWGTYEIIGKGKKFQVKQLTVRPGEKLSLQKHKKRAEHWVVVSGKARVTRGKDTFVLKENESTFIPLGEIHRLENPYKKTLVIIEVQSGKYLGEDDIERLEDLYGRTDY